MEKKMNIRPILSIAVVLFFATMFASCTKVEMEAPSVKDGAEIRFGAMNELSSKPKTKSPADFDSRVVVAQDPAESRSFGLDVAVSDGIEMPRSGAPLTKGTQVVGINAFDVAAFFYADASSQDGSLLFTETVTDGYTENTYYWPSFGVMNFVALYPTGILGVGNYDNRGNGIQTIADDSGRLQSFSYEIPSAVEQHQDVMVAVTKGVNNAETGEAVPMNFKHLLSAVRFKVGKMLATRINTFTISGVKGGVVTISYNSENDRWEYEPSSDNVSYSPIYSVDGVPNIDTYGLAEGNYITSNDNGMVMFVMPQTLSGAKIHINYTELITGTTHDVNTTLAEHSWVAGQTNTYVININAETLQITIPTPPDADAHYVRVDMQYDLSGLNNYSGEGITISNVTAAAQWLNDGSNNASADKQAIYMKTTLTEMQKNGYFTDEEWQLVYSVDSDGNKTYTKGSANGPERTNNNILGTETLTLTSGSKGTIYLFLDENDGYTDRNGELKLTATVTQNGISREVTLGSGKFKQLCPSWNQNNIGVERFEDGEDDIYPYGFSYNKTVTYTNNTITRYQEASILGKFFYLILIWLFGYSMDAVIPNTEGMAEGFVTIIPEEVRGVGTVTKTIVLDYGALNSVESITSADNGLGNTIVLYNYTGAVDLSELETEIDKSLQISSSNNWTKIESSTSSNPTNYAAFIALTRNRMRELKTVIQSSSGNSEVLSAILHREGEGGADNKGDESGSAIVEWYLPSAVEAQSLVETGTGLEATPISPLDGTYWSSTAGADPALGTNGYAYSYTYSRNTYTGNNSSEDRTTNRKVRAVRKKPTAN